MGNPAGVRSFLLCCISVPQQQAAKITEFGLLLTKQTMLRVHRWFGLAAVLIVFIQAATGCALLYRDSLAQIIDPAGMTRQSPAGELPAGQIFAALHQRYPDFNIVRINYPVLQNGTFFAFLEKPDGTSRYASIDPGNGQTLRYGSVWRFPNEAALLVHYQMMAGNTGLLLVAFEGFLVLSVAISGLIHWWPRRGSWRSSVRIRWSLPARVVLRHLHRTVAVCISALVLMSALTGITMALELWRGSSSAAPAVARYGTDIERRIDHGLSLARTAFPGRGIRDLRIPGASRLSVHFQAPGWNPEANDIVGVDLVRGRVSSAIAGTQNGDIDILLMPIHTGEAAGWAGMLLLTVYAMGLVALSLSGPLMWLQRPDNWIVRRNRARLPSGRRAT